MDSPPSLPAASLEPMDPRLTSVQPGGGVVMRLELWWGACRRWCLKRLWPGYVARMQACRQGEINGCPHEVLDPRDLKYFRNQPNYWWRKKDDPFAWRDRLPFARMGLAELVLLSALFFGTAAFSGGILWGIPLPPWLRWGCGILALGGFVCGLLVVWFFRDPARSVPADPGVLVAPADGRVVSIEPLECEEFIGGPAVKIGIFLSIFNVHINRAPAAARVIGVRYRPGKFLNALRPESARENEQLQLRLQVDDGSGERLIVTQITGAIARRIVCWAKPGDRLERGERFGMIKLGSRTELIIPQSPDWELLVSLGEIVHAGATVLARRRTP